MRFKHITLKADDTSEEYSNDENVINVRLEDGTFHILLCDKPYPKR